MKRSRLVIWIVAPVAVLASLLFIITAVGLSIPREHVASRTLKTKASPELVWQAITDYESQAAWRKDLKRVERLPDKDGMEVWREVYKDGMKLTLKTAERDERRRLVRTVADDGQMFSGRWEYEIAPDNGGGCRLTITEHGEVPNPLFRFASRFIFGHTRSLEAFEKELAAKFGEGAVIE